jgi:hypothetical protein
MVRHLWAKSRTLARLPHTFRRKKTMKMQFLTLQLQQKKALLHKYQLRSTSKKVLLILGKQSWKNEKLLVNFNL